MKKAAYLVLILFTLATSAQAQFEAGLKGGGSLNSFRYTENTGIETSPVIDYYGGIRTSVNLFGNLYVQPELLYSAKGFKYAWENQDVNVNLEYITLPVLLRYEFLERFSILGGVELGALTKAVSEFETHEESARSSFKKGDAAYVAGVSAKLSKVFGVEARYNWGFVPLKELYYSDADQITIKKVKDGYNSNFQLGAYINIISK